MQRKTFFQTTPATTWTITHDAGVDGFDPVIDVYVNVDGSYIKSLAGAQRKLSATQTEITFTEAQQGWATWMGGKRFELVVNVPQAPAPAPSPAPSEYVLDTFTGSGALSGHTGETGAIWSATTVGSLGTGENVTGVDDYALSGGNLVAAQPIQVALIRPSGAPDLTDDHRIEVDFSFVSECAPYMGFQAHGLATYVIGFIADTWQGGSLEINLTGYHENGDFNSLDSPFFFDSVAVNVLHTLRIDIVGAVKTFFLDDTQIMEVTDSTISNHGFPWIMLWDSGGPDFFVSRFRVTPL